MDAIHKIQEEILQLLLLQHGASSNGTRFTDAANMGSPILIRTASDKKYKNSLADLTIANKDLKVFIFHQEYVMINDNPSIT